MAERLIFLSRNEKGQFAAGAPSERRKQWVGERYGRLVVTGVQYGVQRGKKQRTICTCQCDCGNVIETVADYLKQGKKTSCGCDTHTKRVESQRIDLTGRRFGRLTVLEMLWEYPHTQCKCICDCGNETIVRNAQLSNGKTQSCGCLQRERTSMANVIDRTNEVTETGIRFIRQHHKNENGVWEWECECPICGNIFVGLPANIVCDNRCSCGCAAMSSGEILIKDFLDKSNVPYQTQYTFNECRNKYNLRFDFAILDENGNPVHLIEYDGRQHFEPIDLFGGVDEFEKTVKRDNIKNEFCAKNNIPLTRLPYTMSNADIKDTIKNIINP